jgi:hypothetical protein
MEELSSGLEVQATAIVVLITIHKSSIDIFETFDEVLCLIKKKS